MKPGRGSVKSERERHPADNYLDTFPLFWPASASIIVITGIVHSSQRLLCFEAF